MFVDIENCPLVEMPNAPLLKKIDVKQINLGKYFKELSTHVLSANLLPLPRPLLLARCPLLNI